MSCIKSPPGGGGGGFLFPLYRLGVSLHSHLAYSVPPVGGGYAPLLRLVQPPQAPPPRPPLNIPHKPHTSFFIADILSDGPEESEHEVEGSWRGSSVGQDERSAANPAGTAGAGGCSGIKRPWDDGSSRSTGGSWSEEEEGEGGEEEVEVDDVRGRSPSRGVQASRVVCPLDALLRMTSQTFDENSTQPDDGIDIPYL